MRGPKWTGAASSLALGLWLGTPGFAADLAADQPAAAEAALIILPEPQAEGLTPLPARTLDAPMTPTAASGTEIAATAAPPSEAAATEAAAVLAETLPDALLSPASTVVPVERDRAATEASRAASHMLTLVPEGPRAPRGIEMGASLSAPGILRLTGEVAEITMGLTLPKSGVLPSEIILTRRSSVNVLSDAASMSLTINGADPVEVPLDALGEFAAVSVPSTALVHGQNVIQFNLRQPHRIFCGPDASFGAWTEIDLPHSGVAEPEGGLSVDAEGFGLYLHNQQAEGMRTSLITDPTIDTATLRAVTDQISHLLGGRVTFERRSFYSLGTPSPAAISVIASDRSQASFRRSASGSILLHVEVAAGEVPDLSALLDFPVAAVEAPLPMVEPGQLTTLAVLGMDDTIGNTRYYRRDVPFALPNDWLLLANQRAALELHYGFAQGLPEGAMLLIKVNGETVRLLPLDRDGGKIQPPLNIPFGANQLHAGRNFLSFEMMVPGNPADEPCAARRADMLVLLGDTNLTIPPSPPMKLAGMARALSGLDPAMVQAVTGSGDQVALDFAALDISAGLLPSPQPMSDVSLTLAGLGDLALVPLAEAGLSQRRLQDLLFTSAQPLAEPAVEKPARNAPRVYRLSEGEVPQAAAIPVAASAEPSTVAPESVATPAFFSWERWMPREASNFTEVAFLGSGLSLQDWLTGKSAQAVLLRPTPAEPGALWLILGPDAGSDVVSGALNRLRSDAAAQGEAALLRQDGTWDVWTPIRQPDLLTEPSFGNLRTVLGNYASWSPLLFTLVTLFFTLISVVPALLYVVLSRGHRRPS